MTFHSDALSGNSVKTEQTSAIAVIKSVAAIAATIAFLAIVRPDYIVLAGAIVVTSLSLTFVSLLQSPDNWASSSPKLDGIYAVLIGMMTMASLGLAAGSLAATTGFLIAMIVGELSVSALIAVGVSSLSGMYSAPLGVALNLHSRLFGLLGRAT